MSIADSEASAAQGAVQPDNPLDSLDFTSHAKVCAATDKCYCRPKLPNSWLKICSNSTDMEFATEQSTPAALAGSLQGRVKVTHVAQLLIFETLGSDSDLTMS